MGELDSHADSQPRGPYSRWLCQIAALSIEANDFADVFDRKESTAPDWFRLFSPP